MVLAIFLGFSHEGYGAVAHLGHFLAFFGIERFEMRQEFGTEGADSRLDVFKARVGTSACRPLSPPHLDLPPLPEAYCRHRL